MVSMAIEVLPVCLSPIISSLCPLPIGNMESIARIPVSIGVFTDFLSTIEGAGCSIGRYPSSLMGPAPSMGAPKASIILPLKPSPTGTPALFPVLTTLEPSLISVSRPNRIQPISFFLTSCTIPLTPQSKCTISPYAAWSMPSILAIPSPT